MNEDAVYTVDLGNGTMLENVTMNGNNYVYNGEISSETFDGIETVTVSNDDTEHVTTFNHAKLVALNEYPEGWYFVLGEYSEKELKEAAREAQIMFTALATDTLLEE